MSLEIQDEFAARYARHSWNKDAWQIAPSTVKGIAISWWEEFSKESLYRFSAMYFQNPKPETAVRQIFEMFFTSLETRNHVKVPKDEQEAAIQEYLDD